MESSGLSMADAKSVAALQIARDVCSQQTYLHTTYWKCLSQVTHRLRDLSDLFNICDDELVSNYSSDQQLKNSVGEKSRLSCEWEFAISLWRRRIRFLWINNYLIKKNVTHNWIQCSGLCVSRTPNPYHNIKKFLAYVIWKKTLTEKWSSISTLP